jgi:hypothetical protein
MASARLFRSPQTVLPSGKAGLLGALGGGRRAGILWSAWLLITCGGVALSACGVATFIVQQYEGEPLANDRIAILRVNGGDRVRLEELDGEVLAYELHERGSRVHIEMLPGEHELGLADGPGLPLKRRRFVAEAGKVYRPMVFRNPIPRQRSADVWAVAIYEVDRDSDDIVREISQVDRAAIVSPETQGTQSLTTPAAAGTSTNSRVDPRPTNIPGEPTLPRDVTAVGLPNTMGNAASTSSAATEVRPPPLPSGVAPATGPDANPPPAEASPLRHPSLD